MPPPNYCSLRQIIYAGHLVSAQEKLKEKRASLTKNNDYRVGDALTAKGLIDDLEAVLIPYVLMGVIADLSWLRQSGTLLETGTGPTLAAAFPARNKRMRVPSPYAKVPLEKAKQAYRRYFEWFIAANPVRGSDVSGVQAFFDRYPLLKRALDLATEHHCDNLGLACDRVSEKWQDIQTAFFPDDDLVKLSRISTTGNDFHKGGKQVLILEFELNNGTGKVVYKPSPVEIDCRVLGNTAVVNKVGPCGDKDVNNGGAQEYHQDASLSEIINRRSLATRQAGAPKAPFEKKALPTYVILPYNRASLQDSFGFIQFLGQTPHVGVEGRTDKAVIDEVTAVLDASNPSDFADSDWIMTSAKQEQEYFYLYGCLIAMARSISLCDLHKQNLIVHGRTPHLIDVEDALKMPMTTAAQTGLVGKGPTPLSGFGDPDAIAPDLEHDGTVNCYLSKWDPPMHRHIGCAIYRYYKEADGKLAKGAVDIDENDKRGADNKAAVISGLADITRVLGNADCRADITSWLDGLPLVFARYVTLATRKYGTSMRELSEKNPRTKVKRNPSAKWYTNVKDFQRKRFFVQQAGSRYTEWAAQTTKPDWRPLYFALEHPDHVWHDYLNLDVPSFYHRLGDRVLLNSRGDAVDVQQCLTWQQSNLEGSGIPAVTVKSPGDYLPETPTEFVQAQIDGIATDLAKLNGLKRHIKEVLPEYAGGFDLVIRSARPKKRAADPGSGKK